MKPETCAQDEPQPETTRPIQEPASKGQCDCMHDLEGLGETSRCENPANPGDGGLCRPCLFGCAP